MNVISNIISILVQTIESEDNDVDEGNDSDDDDRDENKKLQQSALLDFVMVLIKHGDDDTIDSPPIYHPSCRSFSHHPSIHPFHYKYIQQ